MKKILKLFLIALSLFILVATVKIYRYESEKLAALQEHMNFLANKENVEYVSVEEEQRLAKEEAARIEAEEKAAKEEAERLAKEAEEAKKAEEERLKEEEVQKKKEEAVAKEEAKRNVRLDVVLINQLPEYKNGCEATSLTMMLNYAGITVDKSEVVGKMKVDTTAVKYDSNGKITQWGNPKL